MFYDRLKEICDAKGTTPTTVAKAIDISTGNVSRWKNGVNPKLPILRKLADYLDVPIEALTGEITPEKPGERSELTEYLDQLRERPEMRMLFSVAKNASKEDVEAVARFIESLRKS